MTHTAPGRPPEGRGARLSRRLAAAAVIVGGLIGALLTPLTAAAAPPYATTATVESLAFTQKAVASGTKTELTGAWSLPDNPAVPAGFVVDLPEGLRGLPDAFPLLDTAGAEVGRCVTTATQLVCGLDSTYLQEHPLGLSGDFSFWATVTTEVTETTTVTYDFGDVTASVDVTPDPFICTTDCAFKGRNDYKSGEYQNTSDTIAWDVAVGAGATGMAAGQEVVVTDTIGPDQELLRESATGERYPSLWVANGLQTLPSGLVVPGPIVEVPATDYTVSADGTTVSFTAREGSFYNVHYLSRVTDGGAAGTYRNAAEIRVGTATSSTVAAEVTRHGGSGSGTGTRVGTFRITKAVRGDVTGLDALTYRGGYVVSTPGRDDTTGTFEVQAGETWTSPEIPAGSTVALTESLAGLPENIDWAAPEFSPSTLVIVGGARTEVTLTNTATVRTRPFTALKTLTGPAAAVDRVPDDTRYVLEYSYPAGPGFAAGSGELTLRAGAPVTSPALPVGAEVTVRERRPEPVEGVTWGDPEISPERFTVGDETVTVAVRNPVSVTPPPPAPHTPEKPGTPVASGGSLATTGGEPASAALLAGALLLGAGGALAARRRARRVNR